MGQKETAMNGKNQIIIYGPKADGTYVVECRTAAGQSLAISVPRGETGRAQALPSADAARSGGAGRARARHVQAITAPSGGRSNGHHVDPGRDQLPGTVGASWQARAHYQCSDASRRIEALS